MKFVDTYKAGNTAPVIPNLGLLRIKNTEIYVEEIRFTSVMGNFTIFMSRVIYYM